MAITKPKMVRFLICKKGLIAENALYQHDMTRGGSVGRAALLETLRFFVASTTCSRVLIVKCKFKAKCHMYQKLR